MLDTPVQPERNRTSKEGLQLHAFNALAGITAERARVRQRRALVLGLTDLQPQGLAPSPCCCCFLRLQPQELQLEQWNIRRKECRGRDKE